MSHVVKIKTKFKDLDALAAAAQSIGCELVRGKKTYEWFGRHVGDYPLPEGFTKDEMGHCEHAIRVVTAENLTRAESAGGGKYLRPPYEVGVVKSKDGDGYTLLWDFFGRGYGLQDVIGDDAKKLVQAYAVEVAQRAALRKGYRVQKVRRADGTMILTCQR